jgi:hypothetical protein
MQNQNTSKSKRILRRLLVIVSAIVVIVVIAVVYLANSPKTLDKLSKPAVEQNTQNATRQNDVSKIAAAANEYISTHSGNMPKSPSDLTVQLEHYQSGAVSYQSYSSDLKVPDANTVYIVNGASCNTARDGIGNQSSGRVAVVMLYALSASSAVQQQCLSL